MPTYKCDIIFEDSSIGKIILYRIGDEIHLNGRMQVSEGHTKGTLESGEDCLLQHLNFLSASADAIKWMGLHKTIPYEGLALGGAIGAYIENTLYVNGRSNDFGPIDGKLVEECVKEKGIKVVKGRSVL